MQVELSKIDSSKVLAILVILVALFLIISFAFLPGYTKIKELREENQRQKREAALLQQEISNLDSSLERIHDDPFYLEKVAREELGASRDNEITLKIE